MERGILSVALEPYKDLLALDSLADAGFDGGDFRIKGGVQADLHFHGLENHEHLALRDHVSGAHIDGPNLPGHGGTQVRGAIMRSTRTGGRGGFLEKERPAVDCDPAAGSIGTHVRDETAPIYQQVEPSVGSLQELELISLAIQRQRVDVAAGCDFQGDVVKSNTGQVRNPFDDFQGLNGSGSVGLVEAEPVDAVLRSAMAAAKKASAGIAGGCQWNTFSTQLVEALPSAKSG